MKISTRKRGSGLMFNMTPLIDITLNLIIFAVLISHFAHQEERLIRLPKADQAQEKKEHLSKRLIVTIPREGVVMVKGKPYGLRESERVFRTEIAKNPQLSIQIRADGGMSYKTIQQIMRRCAQAGIWQVSFAVDKKSEDLKTKDYNNGKKN